ncbi:GNAT family N-acetyltransferase [Lacticaseibacillus saniviri]|uniref:GNAT family acetyltraansferase n=1 Tax=Lacticaseibacillus saniviri JCM 17471 = DSM 24301 TaxID=1293598 RepID=A0A0R2MTG4_9LACO|nr:GNAT family N-acetyltransferase [Lacticaseibacillus saniviri]KRO16927.1 GNAT family acetyltraansferase [Lacticaseibacillus saniviri JCM 17471 = DSM 24301]MCG4281966.1 GNAT family N-acetyltransferase [Lacticaseibacillus saniviri]
MTTRQLTAQDEAELYALARYAFNLPSTPNRDQAFQSLYDHSAAFGTGEPLDSGFLSTKFDVNFHGTTYAMRGIGYVASYPEASGKGSIGQLMTAAFDEMQQHKVTVSYLAPFSSTFYRRFGYEDAFTMTTHTIAARDFPRIAKSPATVVRTPFADAIPAMSAIYANQSATKKGGVIREDWWWDNIRVHRPQYEVALAYLNDAVSGYIIYSRNYPTLTVHESFANDVASLRALWRFIGAHQTAFEDFSIQTADPELQYDFVPEARHLKTTIAPYMMARIVDVADFLNRYPYQIDALAPVILEITDDNIVANNGKWQLAIADGQGQMARVSDETPSDIQLRQEQLVQASFGVRSLQQLAALERVSGEASAIAQLSAAFKHERSQLYDYF